MTPRVIVRVFLGCFFAVWPCFSAAGQYHLSPQGNDGSGDGSRDRPWRTLAKALGSVPDDGSEILVADGIYVGGNSLARAFRKPVRVRAETPYRARFVSPENSNRVLYIHGLSNVVFEGLEFYGSGSTQTDYLVQITTKDTHDLRFENCIIHDSYKNDLIKINDHARDIVFSGCVFFNQTNRGGDEHFDINTVTDITVEDGIFFNDYPGSGRPAANGGHSFIVVKNSGSTPNVTKNIRFRRNVFLNWSGKKDNAFILLGEDGRAFFEAQDILIENNLFLHHSDNAIWGALLYKGGAKNVVTRANTFTGHPKTEGFGVYGPVCLNIGENPKFEGMVFANNIFCDNTGKMPRFSSTFSERFRGADDFRAVNNLYWNGGRSLVHEPEDHFTVENDPAATTGDPRLPDVPTKQVLPRIDSETGLFLSGTKSIREEFERLVKTYAVPAEGSAALGKAEPSLMPEDDILGRPRGKTPDLGCYQVTESGKKASR